MLIILGGLPGVGKSTIAKGLAESLKAVYLRIDTIEQAIKDASTLLDYQNEIEVIGEGYMVSCALAKDNLEIGAHVVLDSVNSIEITRQSFRKVAQELEKPYIEIELICSDSELHRQRVESRISNIPNLKLPSWQAVCDREYELWYTKDLTIDTAKISAEQAILQIKEKVLERSKQST